MSPLENELQEVWMRLWRHLQRAQGFTLCLLFSAAPPASRQLQERLRQALRWRATTLQVLSPLGNPDGCVDTLRALTQAPSSQMQPRSPLWLALDEPARSGQEDVERRQLLAALNARRGCLEADFARPLVLCLPQGYNATVWTVAPDLWTIRSFVGALSPAGESALPAAAAAGTRAPFAEPARQQDEPLAQIAQWRGELQAQAEPAPAKAAAAIDAALHEGAMAAAEDIATQQLRLARARHSQGAQGEDAARRARDLAASANNMARVAQARGEWARAEALYREGLQETHHLATLLGTPEALRDLARSFTNVGLAAQAQGEWSAAHDMYRDSLLIWQQLAGKLDTAEAWRELAVALNQVGQAARTCGEVGEARTAYDESLRISRQLSAQLGTPESQHHLVQALNNVGRTAQVQGDFSAAESAFRESLQLSRELAQQLRTPEAQREVVAALNNVGQLVQLRGEWARAEALYRDSLELARELAERLRSLEAQRDLSQGLNSLGRALQEQGEWAQAETVYRESLKISYQLAERLRTREALRDLSFALNNVGRAAQAQDAWEKAEPLLRESVEICRTLVSRSQHSLSSRDDLGIALQELGKAELRNDNTESLDEAERIYLQLLTERPDNDDFRNKLARVRQTLQQRAQGS